MPKKPIQIVNIDSTRKIKCDVVVSMTDKGDKVGVYYADTDGSKIICAVDPELAKELVRKHNKTVKKNK